MRRPILIPLPDKDFDTTEVAVPWRLLIDAGREVVFATERGGATPACDPLLLTGVIFGQLGAAPDALRAYEQLRVEDHAHPYVSARWPGDAYLLTRRFLALLDATPNG